MTDHPPTRIVSLRISTTTPDDPPFRRAAGTLLGHAETLAADGLDVLFMSDTDHAAASDEHPERDALLTLAASWRKDAAEASGASTVYYETFRHCADDLTGLVATLNL